jgi:hypothetical protein
MTGITKIRNGDYFEATDAATHYLNGHILVTYCLKFILILPIILISRVIQFISLRPDISIFLATDKHFRISDTYQEHGEKIISASDIQLLYRTIFNSDFVH